MESSWQRPKGRKVISSHTLGKVSELMVLDQQYGVLVHKRYTQDIEYRKAQLLFSKHMHFNGPKSLNPYFSDQGIDFFYLHKNDIFLVAATTSPDKREPISNITFLDILQRLYDILKNCVGAVNEAYISVNRMLVFEILDEIATFGYSLPSSFVDVKPFLTLEPVKPKVFKQDDLTSRLFGINVGDRTKISAPSADTKPKTPNSAYINIVEGVSVISGPNGEIFSCELWGKLTLISNLDRPSPIVIELNPDLVIKESISPAGRVAGSVNIDRPSFHSCVDASNLNIHKLLRVMPPSGQTRLMEYTLSDPSCISIPIILIPKLDDVEESQDKNLKLRLINQAESYAVASYVQVKVQFPPMVSSAFISTLGEDGETSRFKQEEKLLEWEVKRMGGRSEHVINSRLKCNGDKELCLADIGPITLTFNLTQFSASGLVVNKAKVENKGHQTSVPAPQCFFGMSTKTVSYTVRTDSQAKSTSSVT